jgi:5-hydroxyisourate hydrolase
MSLSTHVLDTATGAPAAGVPVTVERADDAGGWARLADATTDADGRVGDLLATLDAGHHRITFATGAWAAATGGTTFFPEVSVVFDVTAPEQHHHVPLLLSPYGYSTYRGS